MKGSASAVSAGAAAGITAGVLVFTFAVAVLGSAPAIAESGTADYSQTKTLTREHLDTDGTTAVVDTRTVTVNVDHTSNLRGRETVRVTWSGAHPTGGRTVSPYSLDGMGQEYPVLVLQCRGVDDPGVPEDEQIRPESCFTTSYTTRWGAVSPTDAVWMHDRYADPSDRLDDSKQQSWPAQCTPGNPFLAQRLVPFVGANGTEYYACNAETQAPEMAIGSALPPNDLAAYTQVDGTGTISFEARTKAENESLGCSVGVPCAIVVIPIMGISCDGSDSVCRKSGYFEPGSVQIPGTASPDAAVSAKYWWSASNWRNRFVVPITFQPAPDTCDLLDDRPPVEFFGSEVLAQATLQWAPAYCLRQDRFKFRHNRQPESVALRTALRGDAAAALVARPGDTQGTAVGYAPVAVSGWGIGFIVDKPGNGVEVEQLRLTPRLLAKLLTNSYPGANLTGPIAGARPDIEGNPFSMNVDPEFVGLNPDLTTDQELGAATVLSLSIPSDVVYALSDYIQSDPEAAAFLAGAADPWGMRVNSAYQGTFTLPTDDWPLADPWVLPSGATCDKQNPTAWFLRLAAPVSSLDAIAQDVLDAWPTSQYSWNVNLENGVCNPVRAPRQPYGERFMLGVVALGDAARYGVRVAELRASGTGADATFAGPSDAALAAAVSAAAVEEPGAAVSLTAEALRSAPSAYPGTMVVQTVAKLDGLPADQAKDVAEFVRIATSEGQVRGDGVGELPDGFLPIMSTGPTAQLFASAQVAADAIEAQEGTLPSPDPTPTPTPTPTQVPVSIPTTVPTSPATTPITPPITSRDGLSDDSGADPGSTARPGQAAEPFGPAEAVPQSPGATPALTPTGGARNALPAALGLGAAAAIGAPVVRRVGSKKVVS